MKKFTHYDAAAILTELERLPVGGYVCKILNVEMQRGIYSDAMVLNVDVCEGEYTGFYSRNYKNQTQDKKKWKGNVRVTLPKDDGSAEDQYTMRIFKTTIKNIEESNPGYIWNWDEQSLKGLVVGVIARNKEYDYMGKTGFWTELFKTFQADKVRTGEYKMPKDKLLKEKSTSYAPYVPPASANAGFAELDEDDGELPF